MIKYKIIELISDKLKHNNKDFLGFTQIDYNKLVNSIKIFYPILLQKNIKLDKIKFLFLRLHYIL